MTRPPQISDAELEVMKVLWDHSPRSGAEVADALCDRMEWNPRTVKTLLGRLVKKGALRYKEEGNRYLYRPAIARDRYVEEESRSFLDRVFGGHATPMLVHFVQEAKLSESDIEELKEILEKKKEEER